MIVNVHGVFLSTDQVYAIFYSLLTSYIILLYMLLSLAQSYLLLQSTFPFHFISFCFVFIYFVLFLLQSPLAEQRDACVWLVDTNPVVYLLACVIACLPTYCLMRMGLL